MPNSKVVPELYCSDFPKSLQFYTKILGFEISYARLNERFAFLEREGAEIMIEQPTDPSRAFIASELIHPYGRGMNLQILVSNVETLYSAVRSANCPIHLPIEEKWYRANEVELGQRQFVVSDPDGYMLRFAQKLGSRQIELS
jgi:catechol 2,3-dioxygenase-like lactoylglutathione lyase family enzyme